MLSENTGDVPEPPDFAQADARVLGQLLAAQTILALLPSHKQIADFYATSLASMPGIRSCRVCLKGVSSQAGEPDGGECAGCTAWQAEEKDKRGISAGFECGLAGQPGIHICQIRTMHDLFGLFVFRRDDTRLFELYIPFISNLANFVALSLENRLQRMDLQKARDVLEARVEERTEQLESANRSLLEEIEARKSAEDGLRESEEKYRRLHEGAGVAIGYYSPDGVVISYNRLAASNMNGVAADFVGQSIYDLFPVNEAGVYMDRIRRSAATDLPGEYEDIVQLPSGEKWFLSIFARICDAQGNVIGVQIISQDITERKQTENQLRRLNRELQAMSGCNQILLRAADEQMLLTEVCRIVCDQAGYLMAWAGYAERDDAKTVRPVAWAGAREGDFAAAKLTWADTGSGSGPTGAAIRLGRSVCVQDFSAEPLPVEVREEALRRGYRSSIALPLKDETSNVLGVLSIYSSQPGAFTADEVRLLEDLAGDLAFGINTLRTRAGLRRAERERERLFVRAGEERDLAVARAAELDAFFTSMTDAVSLYSPDGSVVRANEAAAGVFSFTEASPQERAALYRCVWENGKPVSDEDFPLQRALRGESMHEAILSIESIQTGQAVWLAVSAAPVRDPNGHPLGAVLTARNISERKLAQDEILKLNRELEQRVAERTAQLEIANRELEAFAYSVSHDLRAPLRAIDGFIGLLKRKIGAGLDEQGEHYMQTIVESARRMAQLIDDLLSFSRMGRVELAKMKVDLGALVREVIGDSLTDAQGRVIHWHVDALPVVTGDRSMLRVVMVNLISNALKFTRSREEAEIEIGCAEGSADESVIFVRDNGVGFDMQYKDKLFGVFQRLHRADEFEGTGIGLANIRRIINRHGGRTWAEGNVGGGATFYFSLPSGR